MSRWRLSTVQFGQTLEFAWLARDLTPIEKQKARRHFVLRSIPRRSSPAHAPPSFVVCPAAADPLGVTGRAAEPRRSDVLPAAGRLRAAAGD